MNFPYQILEFELESLFDKRWDENHAEPFLWVYWIEWFKWSHFWLGGGPLDWSFMLAYFMSWIRINAFHVDVNDVLPPNGAQILV